MLLAAAYFAATTVESVAVWWRGRANVVHEAATTFGTWLFCGVGLFFTFGYLVLFPLWRRLLGRRSARWSEFGSLMARDRLDNTIRGGVFGCLVWAAAAFLCMDCYTRVTPTEFAVNRFWGVGENAYTFDRIREINLSYDERKGDYLPRREWVPCYEIKFDDGETWSSRHWSGIPTVASIAELKKLAGYVVKQSEVRLQAQPR